MASIYLRGKTYWARIKGQDGSWRSVSTKVKAKGNKEASQAKKVADEMEAFELGLKDMAPSEAMFQEFARNSAKRVYPEQFKDQSIREFYTAWMERNEELTKLRKMSDSTLSYYETAVSAFLEWMGARAARSFRSLSPKEFSDYRDQLLSEGKGGSTTSKYLKTLSVPMNDAWKQGALPANPLKAVTLPTGQSNKRKVFSDTDVRKLTDSLKGEWLTVFLFGLYTGARLGDCARMRWEFIDIFAGTVEFTQRKTKRKNPVELKIPLHSVLWDHLKAIRKTKGLITPGLAERIGTEEESEEEDETQVSPLSLEFGELMEAAGVSQESKVLKSGRKFSAKSFHSLRHTITSALSNQAKVGEEVRARLTGHKLKGMNQHYTHTEIEQVREALAKVSFGG